jgi:SAM-dependent methyltransferase
VQDLWSGEYRQSAVWPETAEALIGIADLHPGMRVLDVGSAGGGTMFPALERIEPSGSIVGIEVDEDWVEWLRKRIAERGIENAENLLMNGQSMSFPNASFDAVIVGLVGLDEDYDFQTGEILNEAPLMREVLRVLKPGCYLYNSGWLWQEDNEWLGELVRRHLPDCTKRGYCPGTEEGNLALLQFAGFEEIRATRFEGRYTYRSPAEWMACIGFIWEEELRRVKADPGTLRAFEQDAFVLLAEETDPDGQIVYTRSATLVSARKPAAF